MKDIIFYNDVKELKFGTSFTEKWREVVFDDLTPCTQYSFSIETVYKLPSNDGTEGDTKRSYPKSIVAETLCSSVDEENDIHSGAREDDYGASNDETTPSDEIPTTTPPPIQPISDVVTEQTVQVLTNIYWPTI